MELTREAFVEHFQLTLRVQCLKSWPGKRRSKRQLALGAPTELAPGVVQWLRIANGRFDGPAVAFVAPVEGAIERLYGELQAGTAPDAHAFAGAIYDALVAAGLSLEIGPPLETGRPVNGGPRGIPMP